MGPVAQIRAAVEGGAVTTTEIATATGLPGTLVNAVLQHFHRPASCSSAGCAGCPAEAGCGGPVLFNPGPAWNNGGK
ncbi:hypothetical protein [Corynebacterium sp.]|uniref:hypothetical protein n=1 Tax=Corynebacterium sp. TaxID=1720 RepID=UPI0026DF6E45|nr:hypothetical protein [Corynebacterium sp.]MDO5511315.1 hypothetical protein [Corynebacterium sp.]